MPKMSLGVATSKLMYGDSFISNITNPSSLQDCLFAFRVELLPVWLPPIARIWGLALSTSNLFLLSRNNLLSFQTSLS